MGQLFGQSEAPMMVSTLAPADHLRPDGSIARERLSSAGRPTPLVTVGDHVGGRRAAAARASAARSSSAGRW